MRGRAGPAYEAGISNGMKIVAVNGRRFSIDELKRAIAGSKDARTPMEFIVDNAGFFRVVTVDYHGGLRYPHLERTAGANDGLTMIATRRTQVDRASEVFGPQARTGSGRNGGGHLVEPIRTTIRRYSIRSASSGEILLARMAGTSDPISAEHPRARTDTNVTAGLSGLVP